MLLTINVENMKFTYIKIIHTIKTPLKVPNNYYITKIVVTVLLFEV